MINRKTLHKKLWKYYIIKNKINIIKKINIQNKYHSKWKHEFFEPEERKSYFKRPSAFSIFFYDTINCFFVLLVYISLFNFLMAMRFKISLLN